MTKKTDTCAHCHKSLGPARLYVSKGATEGPIGDFHPDCYGIAWEQWRALRGSPPVDGGTQ